MPPLVNEGGGLVSESVGKADLMSNHFDSKQSREAVDLPLTCRQYPSLTTFAFRSREVRRLLLDLDPYGDPDLLGMFLLFLERTPDVMAGNYPDQTNKQPKHFTKPGGLSAVFRLLVRLGSFPPC